MNFETFFTIGLIPQYIADKGFTSSSPQYILLMILSAICAIVIPYLLGSINFSIIISKKQYNQDIRDFGSQNAGMTNMMRTYGSKAAGLTLLGDALKAVVAGLLGYVGFGQNGAYFAGLFCILGHLFPVFFRFRGGKGVVTAAMTVLMCNPFVFLILLILFVIIVLFSKYISLGSVMCILIYPVLLNRIDKIFFGVNAMPYHAIAILIAILIVFKHIENIKRLMNGTERKFSFKKSKDKISESKEK